MVHLAMALLSGGADDTWHAVTPNPFLLSLLTRINPTFSRTYIIFDLQEQNSISSQIVNCHEMLAGSCNVTQFDATHDVDV